MRKLIGFCTAGRTRSRTMAPASTKASRPGMAQIQRDPERRAGSPGKLGAFQYASALVASGAEAILPVLTKDGPRDASAVPGDGAGAADTLVSVKTSIVNS